MSIHHSSGEMDGIAVVYWWGGSSFWLLSYLTQTQWLQQSALILMGCFKLILIVHFGCGDNMICGNKNPTHSHGKVFMKEIIYTMGGATGARIIFPDSLNYIPNVTQHINTRVPWIMKQSYRCMLWPPVLTNSNLSLRSHVFPSPVWLGGQL